MTGAGGKKVLIWEYALSPPSPYLHSAAGAMTDRWLWLWCRGRLEVQRGKEHGEGLEWRDVTGGPESGPTSPAIEECYRGWYDPMRREVFVIRPRSAAASHLRAIPAALDRSLHRRFGEELRYLLY